MSAPSIVQSSSVVSGTATSQTITLTDVVPGNSIVVYAQTTSSAIRTFTVTDDQDDTFSDTLGEVTSGFSRMIRYAADVQGGTTVITVTASASIAFQAQAYEVTGVITADAEGTFTAVDDSNAHYATAAEGVTVAAYALVFVWSRLNASTTSQTAGVGYTALVSGTQNYIAYQRTTTTALSSHRGSWTSTGTARKEHASLVSFTMLSYVGDLSTTIMEVQGA